MRAIPTTIAALALVTAGLAAAPIATAQPPHEWCDDGSEPPETVDECLPDTEPVEETVRDLVHTVTTQVEMLRDELDGYCDGVVSDLPGGGSCNLDGDGD